MSDDQSHNGLGGRIKAAREEANLTQLELALKIGVRERTIIRWEKNKHAPRTEMQLWKVAKATRKPLEFFKPEVAA